MTGSHRWRSLLLIGVLGLALQQIGCEHHKATIVNLPETPKPNEKRFLSLSEIEPCITLPPASTTIDSPPADENKLLNSIRKNIIDDQPDTAIHTLEKKVIEYPGWIQGYRLLATLYWRTGDEIAAADRARLVLRHNKQDGFSHYILGMRATAIGDFEEALTEFRIALMCPDTLDTPERETVTRYRLALRLMVDGYLTASLEQYKHVEESFQKLDPASIGDRELDLIYSGTRGTVIPQIADLCEKLNRYREAAQALETLATQDGSDPDLLKRYVLCLARDGQSEKALDTIFHSKADTATLIALLTEIRSIDENDSLLPADLQRLYAIRQGDQILLQKLIRILIASGRLQEAEQYLLQNYTQPPHAFQPLFDFALLHKSEAEAVAYLLSHMEKERPNKSAIPADWSHTRSCIRSLSKRISTAKETEITESTFREQLRQVDLPEDIKDVSTEGAEWDYLQGCIAQDQNNHESAKLRFSDAIDKKPDWMPPAIELASVFMDQYQWQEALDILKPGAIEEVKDAIYCLTVASAYNGLDSIEQAILWYSHAASLQPLNSRPLVYLGDLYRRQARTVDAYKQFHAAYKRNSYDDEALEKLIITAFDLGRLRTLQNWMKTLQVRSPSRQRLARCQARIELDARNMDYQKFRQTLLDSIGDGRADPDTLHLIAYSYFEQENYPEARQYVEQALLIDPDHHDSNDLCLWIERYTLHFEEALARAEALRRKYPNRSAWRGHQLDILNILQRHDQRIAILEPLTTDPNLPALERDQYRSVLAGVLQMAGRIDEGIVILRGFCNAEPKEYGHRKRLLEYLGYVKRYQDAADEAENWYAETDGRYGRTQWITALGKLGKYDEASRILFDILDEKPTDDVVRLEMIGILTLAGRNDDAIELSQANLSHGRYRRQYEEAIWQALDASGRHDEAVQRIQQWIYRNDRSKREFSPDDLVMLRAGFLADQLFKDQQFEFARRLIRRWIDDSEDPRVTAIYLRRLAECDRLRGDLETSLASLERAYELYPTDITGMNGLGYQLADTGRDLDRAEQLIRSAVALDPVNPAYLDSLGWLLYKRGNFNGAFKWLKLAAGASWEVDPEIWDHLGDAYWRLGQSQQAVLQWEKALKNREKRVHSTVDQDLQNRLEKLAEKLKAVENGALPPVAPLAVPVDTNDNDSE